MANLETKYIVSSSLNKLNGVIKDLINYGIWFLYEIKYFEDSSVKYLLYTENQDLLLTKDGHVIGIRRNDIDIEYISIINFEDIPHY